MKNYEYKVKFSNGEEETVIAQRIKEAVIIAQSEQIKKGHSYIVISTHQVK